jgi:hypothetical protein
VEKIMTRPSPSSVPAALLSRDAGSRDNASGLHPDVKFWGPS